LARVWPPFSFLHHDSMWVWVWVVSVVLQVGEWEWRYRGDKLLVSLPLRVQGKKKTHSAIQNDIVLTFFFMNSTWNDVVLTKTRRFILKEKGRQNVNFLVLQFGCFFHLDPWFQISSIKSLIDHQTLIFIQLSPWFDQINPQRL
jgi:hypothetical protein